MSVSVSEGEAPAGWNEFLASNTFGNFYQTTFYADYAKREAGLKPFFIRVEENGAVKGQLVAFEGSPLHGLLSNLPFHLLSTKLSRKVLPSFNWVYGPIAESETVAFMLIDRAKEVAGGKIGKCSPHPLLPFSSSFREHGFKEAKWATFLINLGLSEEELWDNVDNSARKLVNRTLEQVDITQVESEEDYKAYHDVVNENRARNKVSPYRYSPLLWQIWRDNNCGAVFIAKEKTSGKVLAGLGVSSFNGYLNEWGAGTSSYALENKIYAQDAVKWSIIKWGKQNGFKYFDLTGVNPAPANDKEKGIFRFKEKWGGKLVEYGVYST